MNPPGSGDAPQLAVQGRIATITLRRPAVANRLAFDDLATFRQLVAEVEAMPELRVLRLRGEGRHFCSGFDVGRVGADGPSAATVFEGLAEAIQALRPVTVVDLQGGAYGGAVDLALAADFRVGCPASELMIPAARLGLHFYRGGLERLVARIGLPWARRLLLACDRLDAATLQTAGLIDRMTSAPDAVGPEAARFAAELAELAPLALQGMKRHLNRIARGTLDVQALQRDIDRAAGSEDLREGARAWSERRPPVFRGR